MASLTYARGLPGPDAEVETCGHNRRRVIGDPSVNTRLAPRGSDPHRHPPFVPSLAMHMHAASLESESCYDMHIDQIAPCVLCIPYDCTAEIRFFCFRRPRSPFFRGDPARSLISATLCIREMRDASRSFEMSVPSPRGVCRKEPPWN